MCSAFIPSKGLLCLFVLFCLCSLQASWTRPEQHKVEILYPCLHKLNYEDSHQFYKSISHPIRSLKSHQIHQLNYNDIFVFNLRVEWCSCSFHFLFSAWPLFHSVSNQLSHYDIILFHYDIRMHSWKFHILKKLYNVFSCSCYCDVMIFSCKQFILHKIILSLFRPRHFFETFPTLTKIDVWGNHLHPSFAEGWRELLKRPFCWKLWP